MEHLLLNSPEFSSLSPSAYATVKASFTAQQRPVSPYLASTQALALAGASQLAQQQQEATNQPSVRKISLGNERPQQYQQQQQEEVVRPATADLSQKCTPLYAGMRKKNGSNSNFGSSRNGASSTTSFDFYSGRAQTPIPAPRSLALRNAARERFNKSASFPKDQQAPTLSMFQDNGAQSQRGQAAAENGIDGAVAPVEVDADEALRQQEELELFMQQQQQQQQQYQNGSSSARSYANSRILNSKLCRASTSYYARFSSLHQPSPQLDPALPSPLVIVHGQARSGFNKSVQERKHRGASRNVLGGFYTS